MKIPANSKGRIIITCGPSFEPIDQVRRITNLSTGKLGIQLANRLARSGWQVTCFKGSGATHPEAVVNAERLTFETNDHLLEQMSGLFYRDEVIAVFHAAALCDYRVKEISGGSEIQAGLAKLPSRGGEITLVLEPATKILPQLRPLFPQARIVGWKYELVGDRNAAIDKGWRQIAENGTDVCIVNGAAYGEGFGFLERAGASAHLQDHLVLYERLSGWLEEAKLAVTTRPLPAA